MGYTRWLNNFNKDYKFFDLSPNSKPYREFVNFTGQIWDKD